MRKLIVFILCLFSWLQVVGQRQIKVLAIGNSFSRDAVEQNLHELAQEAGITMTVGNLFVGGCSLERHVANSRAGAHVYQYRKIGADGRMNQRDSVALETALADEDWDVVSVQQASAFSGVYTTYKASLPRLLSFIRSHVPGHTRIVLHQTWAYARHSSHQAFQTYGHDQMKMFRQIVEANRKAARAFGLSDVIPSGTAIQNARTSFLGDRLDRDGYHLDYTVGRYTAACTWLESLTGISAVGLSYAPPGVSADKRDVAQRAAHLAVMHPQQVTDMGAEPNRVVTYPRPEGYVLAPGMTADGEPYEIKVNGKPVDCYMMQAGWASDKAGKASASFAYFDFAGEVEVEVKTRFDFDNVVVRPLSMGVVPQREGRTLKFRLTNPCSLSLEFDGRLYENLHLFANPIEDFNLNGATVKYIEPGNHTLAEILAGVQPSANHQVIYFKPGMHFLPPTQQLFIPGNTTVFIAGGAVVCGRLHAVDAHHLKVMGRGILNGCTLDRVKDVGDGVETYLVRFLRCSDVEVSGIILQDSPMWTYVNIECEKVFVHNFRIIGQHRANNDGMDIVNCRNVTVDHAFIRTIDDAITVKAKYIGGKRHKVADITVQNSVLWNEDAGNAMELGFETLTDQYEHIAFRNIDVIHNQSNAGMSIHLGDDANMKDIVYDDIRFEEHEGNGHCNFIEFYISDTFYSTGFDRGSVDGVVINNIDYMPADIRHSTVMGYSDRHGFSNLHLSHVMMNGCPVMSNDEARLYANDFVQPIGYSPGYYRFLPTKGAVFSARRLEHRQSAGVEMTVETDTLAADGRCESLLFGKYGAWAEYAFEVEKSGFFMPSLHFRKDSCGGTFRVLVDGHDIGLWIDAFHRDRVWQEYVLPTMYLRQGRHSLRLVACSRHLLSGGCGVGVDYINLRPTDDVSIEFEDLREGVPASGASAGYYTVWQWNGQRRVDVALPVAMPRHATLHIRMLAGPHRGTVRLLVDGQPQGEPVDLSAPVEQFVDCQFGTVSWTAGKHVLTFENMSASDSLPLGLDRLQYGTFPRTLKWEAVRLCFDGNVPRADGVQVANGGKQTPYGRLDYLSAQFNKPGDWLEYMFSVPYSGRYRLKIVAAVGPDMGMLKTTVNGLSSGVLADFYQPVAEAKKEFDMGEFYFDEHRRNLLRFVFVGRNAASSANGFQVWRFVLVPVID